MEATSSLTTNISAFLFLEQMWMILIFIAFMIYANVYTQLVKWLTLSWLLCCLIEKSITKINTKNAFYVF